MQTTHKYIFLRDDDVYTLDALFLKTFNFCLEEKIPVIYGVIPGIIDPKAAQFLRKQKERHGSLIDLVQHGWKHKNYSKKGKRHEFGKERNLASQQKDISSGYMSMKEKFGNAFTPAFIPPFHDYDANTLRCITASRIRLFSAGIPTSHFRKKPALLYVPAQVSINSYGPSFRSMPLSFNSIVNKTAYYLWRDKMVGIYFHHSTLRRHNFDVFVKYARFLKRLTFLPFFKFTLFSQILRSHYRYL
jgi:hypothetical protein